MTPAAMGSRGTEPAMRSTLSMPFCSEMTRVCAPINGARARAAASVSHSLTVNSTTSTGPIVAGSSVTAIFATWRLPCGLSMRMPSRRIASRCAPRATRVTSSPAADRRAPRYPPIAPAPMTAIRIKGLLLSDDAHAQRNCLVAELCFRHRAGGSGGRRQRQGKRLALHRVEMRVDGGRGGRPPLHRDGNAVGDIEARILAGDLHEADKVAGNALPLQFRRYLRVEHDHAGVVVEADRIQIRLRLEADLVFVLLYALPGDVDGTAIEALPLARLGGRENILHVRPKPLADDPRIDDQHL